MPHALVAPKVTRKRNTALRRSFENGQFVTPRSAQSNLSSSFGDGDGLNKIMNVLLSTQREDDDGGDPTTARESEDQFQPLAVMQPRRLSKTSSGAALPVTGRRGSQHRRVSELIREAQKPGAPIGNNMAANLTEQAHAFTSSIAIMNMIFASAELMIEAIKAANSPTIGLSSDFHRRFSKEMATSTKMLSLKRLSSFVDEDGDTSPDSSPPSSCSSTPTITSRKMSAPALHDHSHSNNPNIESPVPVGVTVDGAVTFSGHERDP